jgi:hypothetical protein
MTTTTQRSHDNYERVLTVVCPGVCVCVCAVRAEGGDGRQGCAEGALLLIRFVCRHEKKATFWHFVFYNPSRRRVPTTEPAQPLPSPHLHPRRAPSHSRRGGEAARQGAGQARQERGRRDSRRRRRSVSTPHTLLPFSPSPFFYLFLCVFVFIRTTRPPSIAQAPSPRRRKPREAPPPPPRR